LLAVDAWKNVFVNVDVERYWFVQF